MSFAAAALDRHREKWRETPRGNDTDGSVFSLRPPRPPGRGLPCLLGCHGGSPRRRGTGWLGSLYGDTFRARRRRQHLPSGRRSGHRCRPLCRAFGVAY